MPRQKAREVKNRAERQARGTASNTRDLFGSFTFDKVLPSGVTGFLQELLSLIPRAFGRGDAKDQVYASTTLILIALITTPFTLGYSLVVALPFMLTLLIGLYRLNPWVDRQFTSLRGNNLRDRDVPLWQRD